MRESIHRHRPRRGRRLGRAGALLAVVAASSLADQGHEHPDAQVEKDGARLYQAYCSVCHGDRGDGRSRAQGSLTPPPRDFTTPQAAGELSRERMIAAVTGGVPGTAMSGWSTQLSTEQIAAVVDYIRADLMLASIDDDRGRGRQIYARFCSVCHGDRGDGRSRASGSLIPPPRDFTGRSAAADLTRERMIASVTYGRANTAMAPWQTQLSREDIEATVDYVRAAFMRLDAASPASPGGHGHGHEHVTPTGDVETFMAAAFAPGLRADVEWGKRFYDDNCAVCHGVDGDGQGPRAYFILPKPRDFGHPAARAELNRPHLYEAVAKGSTGTEMAAWDKVLTRHEIASVAEYVFRAFIRPQPAAGPVATPAPGTAAPAAAAAGGAHATPRHGDGHGHEHEHEH